MTKRLAIILGLIVLAVAFLLQVAWESPLRPAVSWITSPGCRIAWVLARPDYLVNKTVWRFDLISLTINGFIYAMLTIAVVTRVRRKAG